jgi:hypothetical protein
MTRCGARPRISISRSAFTSACMSMIWGGVCERHPKTIGNPKTAPTPPAMHSAHCSLSALSLAVWVP